MALAQVYSRPFINATLQDAFYRYAYGHLRIIYLGSSGRQGKRGLHLSATVTLCMTGRDYFPRTWCEEYGEILAAPILRGIVPVVPSLSAEVMHILSRFGFKIFTSLENSPKECLVDWWPGHVPSHSVVVR